jgi:ribosomal protein S18 acetylase RimI-like enzyme
MNLVLRAASESERAFCESLTRGNMSAYRARRAIAWDPERFAASWIAYENYVIVANDISVGLLRLQRVDDALEIRDLQLLSEHRARGIGSWVIEQAKRIAMMRGIDKLRLRVYEENPARHLYARLGFEVEQVKESTIHLLASSRSPP